MHLLLVLDGVFADNRLALSLPAHPPVALRIVVRHRLVGAEVRPLVLAVRANLLVVVVRAAQALVHVVPPVGHAPEITVLILAAGRTERLPLCLLRLLLLLLLVREQSLEIVVF